MHIKKLILLLFLVPVLAQAQKTTGPNYTYIAQRYEWLAGVFKALGIPAGDSAQFQTGQEMRAGAMYYDSVGVDSGLYVWSGLAWNVVGTPYTDADARAAISLTTTGIDGLSTYNPTTGVINNPDYTTTASQGITKVGSDFRLGTSRTDRSSFTSTRIIDVGDSSLYIIKGNNSSLNDGDPSAYHSPIMGEFIDSMTANSMSSANLPKFGTTMSRRLRITGPYGSDFKVGHRQALVYELGDSARILTAGGDFGGANQDILYLQYLPSKTTGRAGIGGMPNAYDAAFATLSMIETPSSNASRRLYVNGYIGAHTSYLRMENWPDTIENFIFYKTSGFVESPAKILNTYGLYINGKGDGTHGPRGVYNSWTVYSPEDYYKMFHAGSLAIGDSALESSALIDASSTTKGVIWPRMTTVQKNAIASPATGLIVFDTDLAQYNFWDGDSWEAMGGGAGGGTWGSITGTLSDQTDLQAALDAKISGSLTSTRVPFATGTNTLSDDDQFTWDNIAKRLNLGDGTTNTTKLTINQSSGQTTSAGLVLQAGGVNKLHFAAGTSQSDIYMVNHSFRVYVNGTGNLSFLVAGATGMTYNSSHATTGKHTFQTAGATRAIINNDGLNLAEQAAPSTPAAGLTSIYSTDGNVYSKDDAGTVRKMTTTLTRHGNVIDPLSTDDRFVFSTDVAITITSVKAVLVGSSTPSVTYNIVFDSDRSAAGTNVYTAGQTVTSTTTMTAASGVNDATIPAGSIVRVKLSAVSGTVGELDVSITYTED